jgi:hypothetical protein
VYGVNRLLHVNDLAFIDFPTYKWEHWALLEVMDAYGPKLQRQDGESCCCCRDNTENKSPRGISHSHFVENNCCIGSSGDEIKQGGCCSGSDETTNRTVVTELIKVSDLGDEKDGSGWLAEHFHDIHRRADCFQSIFLETFEDLGIGSRLAYLNLPRRSHSSRARLCPWLDVPWVCLMALLAKWQHVWELETAAWTAASTVRRGTMLPLKSNFQISGLLRSFKRLKIYFIPSIILATGYYHGRGDCLFRQSWQYIQYLTGSLDIKNSNSFTAHPKLCLMFQNKYPR